MIKGKIKQWLRSYKIIAIISIVITWWLHFCSSPNWFLTFVPNQVMFNPHPYFLCTWSVHLHGQVCIPNMPQSRYTKSCTDFITSNVAISTTFWSRGTFLASKKITLHITFSPWSTKCMWFGLFRLHMLKIKYCASIEEYWDPQSWYCLKMNSALQSRTWIAMSLCAFQNLKRWELKYREIIDCWFFEGTRLVTSMSWYPLPQVLFHTSSFLEGFVVLIPVCYLEVNCTFYRYILEVDYCD